MHKNENTQNSHSFLALAFFRGICLSRHQRIWNQHKILRFFDTHNDIFQEKIFWVIIALFAYFKCKCENNCTFSNILQKVKSYFFGHISVWFLLKFQKKYKIEAPYCAVIICGMTTSRRCLKTNRKCQRKKN